MAAVGKDGRAAQVLSVDQALVDLDEGLFAGSADPGGATTKLGPDVGHGTGNGEPQLASCHVCNRLKDVVLNQNLVHSMTNRKLRRTEFS